MKRYTLAVEFASLTREAAAADVAIEAFIFLPSGRVNRVEASFAYELKKYEGAWKVYDATPKSRPSIVPQGAKIVPVVARAAFLVGLSVTFVAVLQSCFATPEESASTTAVTVETPAETSGAAIAFKCGARTAPAAGCRRR